MCVFVCVFVCVCVCPRGANVREREVFRVLMCVKEFPWCMWVSTGRIVCVNAKQCNWGESERPFVSRISWRP